MDHDTLNEQIAYYRARAHEYDESTRGTEELKGAVKSGAKPADAASASWLTAFISERTRASSCWTASERFFAT